MARFAEHPSTKTVKLLACGDSGAGKTHAAGQLANAGYRVFVVDFDNGLGAVGHRLTEDGMKNLNFQILKDDVKAEAWNKFNQLMRNDWIEGEENLGSIKTWGPNDVLIIDTATGMFDAIKNHVLGLSNQKLTDNLSQPQWGVANNLVNNLILRLTSPGVECNVIVNTHWQLVDNDEGASRFYPRLGSKPNSVANSGRHFDNQIELLGGRKGFKYRTKGRGDRDLKVQKPMESEIEADMPKLFKTLIG